MHCFSGGRTSYRIGSTRVRPLGLESILKDDYKAFRSGSGTLLGKVDFQNEVGAKPWRDRVIINRRGRNLGENVVCVDCRGLAVQDRTLHLIVRVWCRLRVWGLHRAKILLLQCRSEFPSQSRSRSSHPTHTTHTPSKTPRRSCSRKVLVNPLVEGLGFKVRV